MRYGHSKNLNNSSDFGLVSSVLSLTVTGFKLKSKHPIRFCHHPSPRGACFAKGILNKFWRDVRACVGHDRAERGRILLLFLQRMACENGLSWQNGINVTTHITTGRAAAGGPRGSCCQARISSHLSVSRVGAKIPLPCNAWWMLNFTFVVYRHQSSIIPNRKKVKKYEKLR